MQDLTFADPNLLLSAIRLDDSEDDATLNDATHLFVFISMAGHITTRIQSHMRNHGVCPDHSPPFQKLHRTVAGYFVPGM